MRSRLIGGAITVAAAALLAAGCSDSPSPAAAPSTPAPASTAAPGSTTISSEHNDADMMFVQGMIPHHTQAITMSAQAADRAASPEVKDLATRIEQAQGPEIEQMNQMLDAWGAPRPQPGSTAMPGMPGMPGHGMPMGGTAMPGMMNDGQMQQLATMSGPAFDRAFLQMMIEHHTGAIQMAQTEQAQGLNPQAKQLAGSIAADQQREITEMQALLGRV